jgi:hypothetical protein
MPAAATAIMLPQPMAKPIINAAAVTTAAAWAPLRAPLLS